MNASIARALAIADDLQEWRVGAHLAAAQAAASSELSQLSWDAVQTALEIAERQHGAELETIHNQALAAVDDLEHKLADVQDRD